MSDSNQSGRNHEQCATTIALRIKIIKLHFKVYYLNQYTRACRVTFGNFNLDIYLRLSKKFYDMNYHRDWYFFAYLTDNFKCTNRNIFTF